ncbi:Hypothetical predicted protein, partial [Pelobates cultripes]
VLQLCYSPNRDEGHPRLSLTVLPTHTEYLTPLMAYSESYAYPGKGKDLALESARVHSITSLGPEETLANVSDPYPGLT